MNVRSSWSWRRGRDVLRLVHTANAERVVDPFIIKNNSFSSVTMELTAQVSYTFQF